MLSGPPPPPWLSGATHGIAPPVAWSAGRGGQALPVERGRLIAPMLCRFHRGPRGRIVVKCRSL